MWKSSRVRAFTFLECLIALLVIAGTLTVYQGLTKLVASNMTYLSQNRQEDWLLFCQQLRSELSASQLDRVAGNRLYVTKDKQALAYGQSRSDDFRKTNAKGQGYQPMLFGLKSSAISQEGETVVIDLVFDTGLERRFVYAFDQAS